MWCWMLTQRQFGLLCQSELLTPDHLYWCRCFKQKVACAGANVFLIAILSEKTSNSEAKLAKVWVFPLLFRDVCYWIYLYLQEFLLFYDMELIILIGIVMIWILISPWFNVLIVCTPSLYVILFWKPWILEVVGPGRRRPVTVGLLRFCWSLVLATFYISSSATMWGSLWP